MTVSKQWDNFPFWESNHFQPSSINNNTLSGDHITHNWHLLSSFTLIIKVKSWKGKLRSEVNFYVTHLRLTITAQLVLCKTRLGCGKLGQATMAKNISQSVKPSKSFQPQGTRLWKFSQHIVSRGDTCWI